MVKKTFLIILFTLMGATVQSQVLLSLIFGDKLNSDGLEFGLTGGYNWSGIDDVGTKKLGKFNLGFYFDITLKNQWHLDTGVLVKSTLGTDKLTDDDLDFLEISKRPEDGSYSQELESFVVPILIKYVFKNKIHVEAGPQVGWVRKGAVVFNHKNSNEEVFVKVDNTEILNKIDAGLAFGAGYKLKDNAGMTVGIKYYIGLVDAYKTKSNTTNNSLFLSLNVPIGAKNKKKETEKTTTKEE